MLLIKNKLLTVNSLLSLVPIFVCWWKIMLGIFDFVCLPKSAYILAYRNLYLVGYLNLWFNFNHETPKKWYLTIKNHTKYDYRFKIVNQHSWYLSNTRLIIYLLCINLSIKQFINPRRIMKQHIYCLTNVRTIQQSWYIHWFICKYKKNIKSYPTFKGLLNRS